MTKLLIVLLMLAATTPVLAAGFLLLAKPAVTCVPGNSTGFMDFSVCSNAGITAAVF